MTVALGDVVRAVIDDSPDDPTNTLKQNLLLVRDWVVRCYRRALSAWPWSFLEVENTVTTSATIFRYNLPVGFRWAISLVNVTNDSPMFPRSLGWIEQADPQRLVTGPPEYYTIWNNTQWQFWPIPDSTQYTIRYLASVFPSPLPSADQDQILIEPYEFIVDGALAYAYRYLGTTQNRQDLLAGAKEYRDSFKQGLEEAIDADRPNVTLPDNVEDATGDEGGVWYNQDFYRSHWFPVEGG